MKSIHNPALRDHRNKAQGVPDQVEISSAAAAIAILGLAACGLETLNLTLLFGQKLQGALTAYVAGLWLLDTHPTARAMAQKLGISHDRLTRLTSSSRWLASTVINFFITMAQLMGHSGWLIIDDVLLPHRRGKRMEGVYWDFDHTLGKNTLGMRLVMLLWTDGLVRLPVAFAVWHKRQPTRRYRTKNEIARILLHWVIRKGIKPSYVTFDAWYASKQNLRLLNHLKLVWVTRIKKTNRFMWQGKSLLANTIGCRLLVARRPYTFQELAAQGRSTPVQWGDLTGLTFVVVKEGLDGEKPSIKYLLSNSACGTRLIIEWYKSRWAIEVFFRDAKQHLGLDSYQGRSLEGAIRHVALVFIAEVVLNRLKGNSEMTLGDAKRTAQSLVVIQDKNGQSRLAIHTIPDWSEPNLITSASEVVQSQLSAVCHLKVPSA
jgi:hypothetical protein